MIDFSIYSELDASTWNEFVLKSKNGTFLINRSYMDYHKDRFNDHSLMVFYNKKLVALLPAHLNTEGILSSHAGLTYGGLITSVTMTAALAIDVFESLIIYLRSKGIIGINYKAIPHMYHNQPAEEDLQALFLVGAKIVRSDVSSTIPLGRHMGFSKLKKRGLKKAEKGNVKVTESKNWSGYWNMLAENLANRYSVEPTHSLAELELLHSRFPNNIRLFTAVNNELLLAGIIIFDCGRTVHVQYIASSEKGRELGAVDAVVSHLVHNIFAEREWFDFGSSTTYEGGSLNVGLSRQKEMYGARTVTYQQYSLIF